MEWQQNRKTHIKQWLRRRTLVYSAKNAAGSKIWAKSFILDSEGDVHDIYENGNLSCAYFISAILKVNDLWQDQCVANVNSLTAKLPDNGWILIPEARIGSIIIYGESKGRRSWATKHVGIIVGEDEVISNGSSHSHTIEAHPVNYMKLQDGTPRKIEGYWWHKDFEDDELFSQVEVEKIRIETPEHKLS